MLLTEKYGDEQNWPQFTWDSKKSHRLRYKMETKWNTQAFDVKKLVLETFELASVEPIESKTEPLDYADDQNSHIPTTTALPIDMDLDAIESTQTMPPPQWTVSATDLPHSDMQVTASDSLSNYNFAPETYSQPVSQSFHQPNWPSAGFLPSNDIVAFPQSTPYMNYMPKDVAPTPQFDSYSQFSRSSAQPAPTFMHQSTPPNARRWVPKIVNIQNHRESLTPPQHQPQEQAPPPPPPKDDHRFSKLLMRRRPSNISQHTAVHQWQDECNWG
jgi:hypothetical protein